MIVQTQIEGIRLAGDVLDEQIAFCRVIRRPPIEDVLDPIFGRVGVAPMIVVIPDGNSRYGCGQWVDSPVTGSFEQYVLHDVIPHVDATYRTFPVARSRGVFGFSSGGFGAWNLASRNPDDFGAMAVLSADSWLA